MIKARRLTKRHGKNVAVDHPVPLGQRPRRFTWARIAGLLVTIVLLTGLIYLESRPARKRSRSRRVRTPAS